MKPVAWARAWFLRGETPTKERTAAGRMAWPKRFKFLPVSGGKVADDDVPLVPAEFALVAARALSFYADQQRYRGPNQRPIPGDAWPDSDGYRLDVTRDGGAIARAALAWAPAPPSNETAIDKHIAALQRIRDGAAAMGWDVREVDAAQQRAQAATGAQFGYRSEDREP